MRLITKGLLSLGLAAGLAVVAAAPASADPYWGRHGGYYGHRHYSRPYVYIAPRVYYPPPPVYYAPPAPVYYAPRPYYPAPAYYAPRYYAPRPLVSVGIGLPPLVFRIH